MRDHRTKSDIERALGRSEAADYYSAIARAEEKTREAERADYWGLRTRRYREFVEY